MKKSILSLLFVQALSISFAQAALNSYSPIVYCGNGDFEVDSMTYQTQIDRGGDTAMETSYQLVLRNQQIIQDFESKGAISPFEINSKGEFMLSQFGTTGEYCDSSNGQICLTDQDNSSPSGDVFKVIINGHDVYLSADVIQGGQFPKNTANFNFPNCQ